jgi:hypothetical protein
MSQYCEYGVDKKSGQPKFKKMGQFTCGYSLAELPNGNYTVQMEIGDIVGAPIETIISHERIEKYYKFIDGMDTGQVKDLGPRPTNWNFDGSPGTYSACDYCELQGVCDSLEKNKAKWMEAVRQSPDFVFLG